MTPSNYLLEAMRGGMGGGMPQAPQPPSLAPGIPPEIEAQLAALRGATDKDAILQQQLAQAQALANHQTPRHTTGGGALLGGLAGAVRQGVGGYRQAQAQQGLGQLATQRAAARDAYSQQVGALAPGDIQGQRKLGLLGMAAGDDVTSKTGSMLLQDSQFQQDFGAKQGAAQVKAQADKIEQTQKVVEGLRKEFSGSPVVKAADEVAASYAKVEFSFKNQGPASDIGMIFGIMKMYDPGASVMEGDVALAQQAQSVPSQILSLYNRVVKGERLPPEVRADFMRQASGLYEAQIGRYAKLASEYEGLAKRYGVPEQDVVLNRGYPKASSPAASAAPAAGVLPPDQMKRLEELRRKKATGQIDTPPPSAVAPSAAAQPQASPGGLDDAGRKRLEELRRKKAAGAF